MTGREQRVSLEKKTKRQEGRQEGRQEERKEKGSCDRLLCVFTCSALCASVLVSRSVSPFVLPSPLVFWSLCLTIKSASYSASNRDPAFTFLHPVALFFTFFPFLLRSSPALFLSFPLFLSLPFPLSPFLLSPSHLYFFTFSFFLGLSSSRADTVLAGFSLHLRLSAHESKSLTENFCRFLPEGSIQLPRTPNRNHTYPFLFCGTSLYPQKAPDKMDTYGQGNGSTRKSSTFRNLQPRAAAPADFNDSDDDDDNSISNGTSSAGGLLTDDYKAQRKTTLDLVDFFKNGPPPPPQPAPLPLLMVDEKKKRTLLQRLRARKSSLSLGSGGFGGGRDRSSAIVSPLVQGAGTLSSMSATSRGGSSEVATLPNGKKYIMIAVDYKDGVKDLGMTAGLSGSAATSAFVSGRLPPIIGSSMRLTHNSHAKGEESGSKHESILSNNPNIHVTTTVDDDGNNNNNDASKRLSFGTDKRRSIIIQAGGGEGSSFILDSAPFLLDSFALDTDFIMTSPTASSAAGGGSTDANHASSAATSTRPNGQLSPESANGVGHRRSHSSKSSQHQQQGSDGGSKRSTKVTFSIAGQQQQQQQPPMGEEAMSKALADRIASHKTQMAKGMLATEDSTDLDATLKAAPEVILPTPVSRKKVRHVQIQTQHCVMRPMYTQTEPFNSTVQDLEVKEFSTQTSSEAPSGIVLEGQASAGSVSGMTEFGTSTDSDSTITTPITKVTPGVKSNSKVASLVASLSQSASAKGAAATTTSTSTSTSTDTTPSPSTAAPATSLSSSEHEELLLLRQNNVTLQTQVFILQRDLAAETRARTRTAVAMQDTRDKFEMLSAMAYKKLKEMIFQRHVLEMEVRELRAQVDLQAEQEHMYRNGGGVGGTSSNRSSNNHHQEYITVGLQ